VLSIDLSNVSESLEGCWVVFSASSGSPLGSGDTPLDAVNDAQVETSDPNILLVLVPSTSMPISA
jgi:hypothetical protein